MLSCVYKTSVQRIVLWVCPTESDPGHGQKNTKELNQPVD